MMASSFDEYIYSTDEYYKIITIKANFNKKFDRTILQIISNPIYNTLYFSDGCNASLNYFKIDDDDDNDNDNDNSECDYSIFNQSITLLPLNIIKIKFGKSFNKSIDKLHNYVEEIGFGYDFNQIIKKYPKKLKKILFGFSFNQLIDNLPEEITVLEIGLSFNQKITKLPNNLNKFSIYNSGVILPKFSQNLKICEWCCKKTLRQLPKTINKLIIRPKYKLENIYHTFDDLTHLVMHSCKIKKKLIFPKNLNKLQMFYPIYDFKLDNLPNSIVLLEITSNNVLNDELDNLPNSIRTLILSYTKYKFPLNYLPNSIKKLNLSNYNFVLNELPSSIEKLELYNYNNDLNNLPLQLKKLRLSNSEIDTKIYNLPESLEFIYMNLFANINEEIILPKNLKYFYYSGGSMLNTPMGLPNSIIESNYNCENCKFVYNYDSENDDDYNKEYSV